MVLAVLEAPGRQAHMQAERIGAKFKVWVVFGERVKMGDGRARLLELIDELGSIRKAVAQFGMSYRYAWGYLRELQKAAGVPLLERRGGAQRVNQVVGGVHAGHGRR